MNSFVKKLIPKKIKLIQPSENMCQAYLEKSQKSLCSSKVLLKIENFDDSTALVYYSMYHSALALLYKVGIKSENHSGTIILLKELFKIDNQSILTAKKERVEKQYYVDKQATKEEVKQIINCAEEFNSIIKEKIDILSLNQLQQIRHEFENYFNSSS